MKNLHVISHTHWDREWYRTFQQFRMQLVHLIDNLLVILDNDPDYLHYMLDGQTIVLEDYLRVRMENFAKLQQYIQENRVLIGPWYILPDEFLVSPESTVRNLLIGKHICELFGQRMMIGYLPDPFGHIGQMPQILRGFNIDTAALWRGVKPGMPTAFTWQAPDGSQVLLAHLYFGYGNIAHWPVDTLENSLASLEFAAKRLELHSNTSQYLMMQGTDHIEPHPATAESIRFYNEHNPDGNVAVHSTLPAFFAALSQEIEDKNIVLPVHIGELRDPQKAHMLPGVLSSRMWIKQRNWKAQTELERWSEPFSVWTEVLERGEDAFGPIKAYQSAARVADPGAIIREAWKTLLKNHTHDSICGCSIDATHKDMVPRFDKIDQINQEIRTQSLNAITSYIDTRPKGLDAARLAITVFNAAAVPATDSVMAMITLPDDKHAYIVVDENGNTIPSDLEYDDFENLDANLYTLADLAMIMERTREHGYDGKALTSVDLKFDEEMKRWCIIAGLSDTFEADEDALNQSLQMVMAKLAPLEPNTLIHVSIHSGIGATLVFRAQDVPAFGYKTYWLKATESIESADDFEVFPQGELAEIENTWLKVSLQTDEKSFSIYDKRSGELYKDLGVLVSVGDRGDEYNFTPTKDQSLYTVDFSEFYTLNSAGTKAIAIRFEMALPDGLDDETRDRSQDFIRNKGLLILNLHDDLPVLDLEYVFENKARDHRLEMHFGIDFPIKKVLYDGHFDIVERPIDLPAFDETWSEHPRPEVPQAAFVDVLGENKALMIANQGLPEVSVTRKEGTDYAQISITMLRSVGWLSRSDLFNRRGHAGPGFETPDAHELGTMFAKLRLIPHTGNSQEARNLAYAFQTEFKTVVAVPAAGDLPSEGEMLSVDHPEFYITAVKEAENQEGYIVRGVNLSESTIEVHLQTRMPAKSVARVMLDESFMEDLELENDGKVRFVARAKEIVTLYFGLR